MVELILPCLLNLNFRDLSVSSTYIASHPSRLVLYTDPTTFPLTTGSLGFTNNCFRVFVSLLGNMLGCHIFQTPVRVLGINFIVLCGLQDLLDR